MTYLIPGNDDAIRAVRLLTGMIADAAVQGSLENQAYRADAVFAQEAELADEPGMLDADLFADEAVVEALEGVEAEPTP